MTESKFMSEPGTTRLIQQIKSMPDQLTIDYDESDGLHVIDGSITANKLANGAVTTDKIADGAIGSNQLDSDLSSSISNASGLPAEIKRMKPTNTSTISALAHYTYNCVNSFCANDVYYRFYGNDDNNTLKTAKTITESFIISDAIFSGSNGYCRNNNSAICQSMSFIDKSAMWFSLLNDSSNTAYIDLNKINSSSVSSIIYSWNASSFGLGLGVFLSDGTPISYIVTKDENYISYRETSSGVYEQSTVSDWAPVNGSVRPIVELNGTKYIESYSFYQSAMSPYSYLGFSSYVGEQYSEHYINDNPIIIRSESFLTGSASTVDISYWSIVSVSFDQNNFSSNYFSTDTSLYRNSTYSELGFVFSGQAEDFDNIFVAKMGSLWLIKSDGSIVQVSKSRYYYVDIIINPNLKKVLIITSNSTTASSPEATLYSYE